MAKAIDVNRGCHITRHQPTGMYVYMYLDDPGKYLNTFGKPVPEALAREAGFDTETYGKLRVRKERMAAAQKAIEEELELQYAVKAEIVAGEAGKLRVEMIGKSAAFVVDEDGNKLNEIPVDRKTAMALYKKLTAEVPA